MKRESYVSLLVASAALLALVTIARAQTPDPQRTEGVQASVGTSFTYQGQLDNAGSPVNDTCDFEFSLWDAQGTGSPPKGGSQVGATQVQSSVAVSGGLFTVQLDFGSGAFQGDARWLQIAVRCPPGGILATLSPRQALTPAPYALALPGLYTQQNATSPNVIGGHSGNSVTSGAVGATIGGGGTSLAPNRVTDDFGTVGGGGDNTAGDSAGATSNVQYSTVSGGYHNAATGSYAAVSGGYSNTVTAIYAFVGGGASNTVGGAWGFVGGGISNTVTGDCAVVSGGKWNSVGHDYGVVGGGFINWVTGAYSFVGGGRWNRASGTAAVVGGDANAADGIASFIGGGNWNLASGDDAVVSGGDRNTASGKRQSPDPRRGSRAGRPAGRRRQRAHHVD